MSESFKYRESLRSCWGSRRQLACLYSSLLPRRRFISFLKPFFSEANSRWRAVNHHLHFSFFSFFLSSLSSLSFGICCDWLHHDSITVDSALVSSRLAELLIPIWIFPLYLCFQIHWHLSFPIIQVSPRHCSGLNHRILSLSFLLPSFLSFFLSSFLPFFLSLSLYYLFIASNLRGIHRILKDIETGGRKKEKERKRERERENSTVHQKCPSGQSFPSICRLEITFETLFRICGSKIKPVDIHNPTERLRHRNQRRAKQR